MNRNSLVACLSAVIVSTLVAFASPNEAAAQRLQANLTGNTAASGKAKFEAEGAFRKLSVEIEDAVPNISYRIVYKDNNGTRVIATRKTNGFGDFETVITSGLPPMKVGGRMFIYRVSNNALIVSGTYALR